MVTPILPLTLSGAKVMKGGKTLVGPVDLTIKGSGCSVIIGPNGAGKSSLLRLMHGLERPRDGHATWNVNLAQAHLAQAFVFQTPILMRRSVVDNIAYPLRVHGTPLKEARAQAAKWATRLGLAPHTNRRASTLSGGERQKMALARALIRAPQVLFLDEPCASLDGAATREIEALLKEKRATGTRVLIATHDMGQARRLGDDVIFLHRGRIVEHAPAADFFPRPSTEEARRFLNGDILE